MDSEKNSWCACGHTKENTLSVPCLPGLQYRFRVTAVNRLINIILLIIIIIILLL